MHIGMGIPSQPVPTPSKDHSQLESVSWQARNTSRLPNHPNYDAIKKSWDDHTQVIKRFGRYPHRNNILQRQSTTEEIKFLEEPNSSW